MEFVESIFPASFDSQEDPNKGPTVRLDGNRPPPISLIVSLTQSQFNKLGPLRSEIEPNLSKPEHGNFQVK